MAGLNDKQQAFIEHYLMCWNASEAARRAGYNGQANVVGPRLLSNVSIQARIQERLTELKMSADEVVTRLTEHARGSLAPFLRISPDGTLHGFDVSEDKPLHLLKRATITKRTFRETTEETVTIEIHDAQAALNLLGKHHRLFTDVTEHTGKDGGPLQFSWNASVAEIAAGSDPGADEPG